LEPYGHKFNLGKDLLTQNVKLGRGSKILTEISPSTASGLAI